MTHDEGSPAGQRPIRIAIVGMGKIARDQHRPAIESSPRFRLAAAVTRGDAVEGVPTYSSIAGLARAQVADAVALCVPPQPRFDLARQALEAGFHVLLEKPPAATLAQLRNLVALGHDTGLTLFAAWHARFAPGVEPARRWLAGKTIDRVSINWREDVRRWHPGQDWLFSAGGLGVFDPGINALSIATRILPPFHLTSAHLSVPTNRQAPVHADLSGEAGRAPLTAAFDFLHAGEPVWEIEVETNEGRLGLRRTGAVLEIDGRAQPIPDVHEYPALYAHFATLIGTGRSDVDETPLTHVADAFMLARRVEVPAFEW